jgi:hypothetical protein
VQFLHIALGSAVEAGYLSGLAARLGVISDAESGVLIAGYDELVARLQRQIASLREARYPAQGRKSRAQGRTAAP